MEQTGIPYRKHILVCTNEREKGACCAAKDSMRLVEELKRSVDGLGLKSVVRVNKTGCLGRCAFGANIMIWPDGTWFHSATESDVPSIIEKHIMPLAQNCG